MSESEAQTGRITFSKANRNTPFEYIPRHLMRRPSQSNSSPNLADLTVAIKCYLVVQFLLLEHLGFWQVPD